MKSEKITLRLEKGTLDNLRKEAYETGRSINTIINIALVDYFNKKK